MWKMNVYILIDKSLKGKLDILIIYTFGLSYLYSGNLENT